MAVAVSCAPAVPAGDMVGVDGVLRDRLPQLWRTIETAHYSYLELDDCTEKLQRRKKLEGYIMEYLSLVPHECKFGLSETGYVFSRTVAELPDFSAYRAGVGWAAIARYAANLLAQPWRKEYRTIRTYCGYYQHEVESNLVGAENMLCALGYRHAGNGRLCLDEPVCPDRVAGVSRDALIAYVECQIMCEIWERVLVARGGVTWSQVARERARRAGDVGATVARLTRMEHGHGAEIYSNIKPAVQPDYSFDTTDSRRLPPLTRPLPPSPVHLPSADQPCYPMSQPAYVTLPSNNVPHNVVYTVPAQDPRYPEVSSPVMNPYLLPGIYYTPIQPNYIIPAPMYTHIKQAPTIPVNGYPAIHRYPAVPTGQLIDLDHSVGYTTSDVPDGIYVQDNSHSRRDDKYKEEARLHRESKAYRDDREKRKSHEHRKTSHRATSSDISLSRSDTQPTLSAAREDGLGTYESWDYVFRNLSQREEQNGRPRRASPTLERDSRTLDRLDDRRRFQPMTMDLEDGLNALNLDRSYDEEIYRTAKINESLARLKQESEAKKARAMARKQQAEEKERKPKNVEPLVEIETMNPKIAPDKVRLISKKDSKDRKEIIKQCSSATRTDCGVKKVVKSSLEEKTARIKPTENGVQPIRSSTTVSAPSDPWECSTCTFVNARGGVCDMCGRSRGPAPPPPPPLASGGRQCVACTLVNDKRARVCDACGTSLHDSPTYI